MIPALLLVLFADAAGRLTFEERAAYFDGLRETATADHVTLREQADRLHDVRRKEHEDREPTAYSQFADLLENPEFWVGRPVCIRGHANLIQTYETGENAAGIDRVYETWIVGEDSDRYPSIIVSQALPPGVEVGEQAVGGLEACGRFLKLLTYKARDGRTRYAPLILAGAVRRAAPPSADGAQWAFVAVAAVFGLSLAWRAARGLRRRPRRTPPAADFDGA